jgi:hypothetical protein
MYLLKESLKEGGGLDGVRQSLAFRGWTRAVLRVPFLAVDNAPVSPTRQAAYEAM